MDMNTTTGGQIPTETAPLGVTQGDTPIVYNAQLDTISLVDVLSHRSTLETGEIVPSAQANHLLFSIPVCPSSLSSSSHQSYICFLSQIFSQWSGEIAFELMVTKPSFVQFKIVMAFIPTGLAVPTTAAALLAFHNSVVLDPLSATSSLLNVPFISTGNWLASNQSTGVLVARLLDPVVASLELNRAIPYTLLVSATPRKFSMRYLHPPPLNSNQPDQQPAGSTSQLDNVTALSNSVTIDASQTRSAGSPLIVQTTSPEVFYASQILIPRSRVPNLIKRLQGSYQEIPGEFSTSDILTCFAPPTITSLDYRPSLLSPAYLYPAALRTIVTREGEPNRKTIAPCFCDKATHTMWLLSPCGRQPELELLAGNRGNDEHVLSFSPVRVIMTDNTGLWYHEWVVIEAHKPSFDQFVQAFLVSPRNLLLSFRLPQPSLQALRTYLENRCLAINTAPPEVTHLALYTNLALDDALNLASFLSSSTSMPPPPFISAAILSFSASQSPLIFADNRLAPRDPTRGLIWKLFTIFGKKHVNKPWAWIIKGLDKVVDFIVGLILGRSDDALAVDIGPDSGHRWEARGEYTGSLPSTDMLYLDELPNVKVAPETPAYIMFPTIHEQGRAARTPPSYHRHVPSRQRSLSSMFSRSHSRHRGRTRSRDKALRRSKPGNFINSLNSLPPQ